ncbi:hypothetical protein RUM4293_03844 [Ruegeria atlantica]|uniref:Uncharacterized protein n=1 Tax=Ruegeria atlantica TaxID=81569 RepID=A0A0P1EQN3_9RHOB|nr:hypothetical protein RUM4293_03844 [Ruegeria atlantica]
MGFNRGKLAAFGQFCDGRVDAFLQGVALFHQKAELIRTFGLPRRELAKQCTVFDHDSRQIECRRQVINCGIDLASHDGRIHISIVVVKQRFTRRLDHVVQHRDRCRRGHSAPLQILEAVQRRFCAGIDNVLGGQNRHGRGVIGQAEINHFFPFGSDRVLLHVEVKVLSAGLNRLVKTCTNPGNIVLVEAHFFGDCISNGGFESLAAFGRVIHNPRIVGRITCCDCQGALC